MHASFACLFGLVLFRTWSTLTRAAFPMTSTVPQGSAQNLTTTGKGHRHFFLSRYSAPVKQGRVSRFCSSGEESEADSEGSSCSWRCSDFEAGLGY